MTILQKLNIATDVLGRLMECKAPLGLIEQATDWIRAMMEEAMAEYDG